MTTTHRHDPDYVECRNCNTTFDLARQHYYDDLCPECMRDANPDRMKQACLICGDRVDRSEIQKAKLVGRHQSEMVSVCSDECAEEANTPPWAPNY